MPPESLRFPVDAKVRFTQERLAVLMPQDRRRLEGRIGIVQGHWRGTRKPVVYFPQDGARSDLRLPQVDPRQLERVEESPPHVAQEATLVDDSDSHEKMSQDELDKLFG